MNGLVCNDQKSHINFWDFVANFNFYMEIMGSFCRKFKYLQYLLITIRYMNFSSNRKKKCF